MIETGEIVVRELRTDLVDDYLHLFDQDAFQDNPWWSGCYCGFYDDPCRDEDWDPSSKAATEHRAARIERIKSGKAQGLLAYIEGRPVGWCNAAPRASYVNLRRYKEAVDEPMDPVGSVMCFVVVPQFRGKGVATALLNAACEKFSRAGLLIAEGYPRTSPPQGTYQLAWSAANYHGPLQMYLKAGFTVHRQLKHYAVVRKKL